MSYCCHPLLVQKTLQHQHHQQHLTVACLNFAGFVSLAMQDPHHLVHWPLPLRCEGVNGSGCCQLQRQTHSALRSPTVDQQTQKEHAHQLPEAQQQLLTTNHCLHLLQLHAAHCCPASAAAGCVVHLLLLRYPAAAAELMLGHAGDAVVGVMRWKEFLRGLRQLLLLGRS
jgi:hypothetical protein